MFRVETQFDCLKKYKFKMLGGLFGYQTQNCNTKKTTLQGFLVGQKKLGDEQKKVKFRAEVISSYIIMY